MIACAEDSLVKAWRSPRPNVDLFAFGPQFGDVDGDGRPDGKVGAGAIHIVDALLDAVTSNLHIRQIAVLMLRHPDRETILLISLGFAGACALGVAFLNAWRSPMLVVRPSSITIPTFFGTRDIPVRPGQPVGEYLATLAGSDRHPAGIEGNKFVHFYIRDDSGKLVELLVLHREGLALDPVRQAFQEIAGLRIDHLKPITRWGNSRPDVSHWR